MTEDDRKVGDGVFEVPKTLSQEHYTALVRSVLMPWGTRSPSETNDLRTAAASNLRDAFGVSKEVHSEALVVAHNANRAVVHELNAHLKDGAGVRDHGDSDDDNHGHLKFFGWMWTLLLGLVAELLLQLLLLLPPRPLQNLHQTSTEAP